jgi:hypothetical protein
MRQFKCGKMRHFESGITEARILDTASTTAYHHPAADGRVEVPVGLLDFKSSTGA